MPRGKEMPRGIPTLCMKMVMLQIRSRVTARFYYEFKAGKEKWPITHVGHGRGTVSNAPHGTTMFLLVKKKKMHVMRGGGGAWR